MLLAEMQSVQRGPSVWKQLGYRRSCQHQLIVHPPKFVLGIEIQQIVLQDFGHGISEGEVQSHIFSTIPVLTKPVLERGGEAMAECSNLMSGKVKMVLELLYTYSDKVFVGVIRLW